jgi:hypothetical protein
MPDDKNGHAPDVVERLRKLCLGLPEAVERETWEEPTYRVREKIFAMQHHGTTGTLAVWCKGGPGVQEMLVNGEPDRYFVPPYLGHKGWIGIRLEGEIDWDEVEDLVIESYRLIAPKRLVKELDAGTPAR